MAQPFAIAIEDSVQWLWRRSGYSDAEGVLGSATQVIGYIWTFAWFSYCLPSFAKGLGEVGLWDADVRGPWAQKFGREHVIALLQH